MPNAAKPIRTLNPNNAPLSTGHLLFARCPGFPIARSLLEYEFQGSLWLAAKLAVRRADAHNKPNTPFPNVSSEIGQHFSQARPKDNPETEVIRGWPLLTEPFSHLGGHIVPSRDREAGSLQSGNGFGFGK